LATKVAALATEVRLRELKKKEHFETEFGIPITFLLLNSVGMSFSY
jgi:hypothetical protein